MDEAQIARLLHFVIIKDGRPRCRPAVVVEDEDNHKNGSVNIQVLGDSNRSISWHTSVRPNHVYKQVSTWHWPRECIKMRDTKDA